MGKIKLFLIGACMATSFAVTAEQVAAWCKGYAEGATAKGTSGSWGTVPSDVTIANGKFTLDLDYATELTFTPSTDPSDTDVVTRILTKAAFVPCDASALPTVSDSSVKVAFLAQAANYYVYVTNAWVALTGTGDWVTPKGEGTEVSVLTELDYKASTPRARFGIVEGTTTNYFSNGWIPLAGKTTPDSGKLASVSYAGSGVLTSVESTIQLGIFEVNNVKYGTSEEAVAAAQAVGVNTTITVLRDNSEDITIPSDSTTVRIDSNNKTCSGKVTNNSSNAMNIDLPSDMVETGNGSYELKSKDDISGKYVITTTDDSKEVVVATNSDNKIVATVRTKESLFNENAVAGKNVPVTDAFRAFLNANSSCYSNKNSTAAGISADLTASGSNGMKVINSYVLGLSTSEKVTLQPSGTDTDTTKITLATPNINVVDGYTVTYQLQKYDESEKTWSNVGSATSTPVLPVSNGAGRYRVNTVINAD